MFSQKRMIPDSTYVSLMCLMWFKFFFQLFSPQKAQKKHKVFTKATDSCFYLCVPYVSYVVQILFSAFFTTKGTKET